MRLLFLLAWLPLAACGSDSAPEANSTAMETSELQSEAAQEASERPDYLSDERTTGTVPPRIGDVAGPEAEPIRVPGPNDVVNIETDEVGVATVEDAEDTYDVNIAQMEVIDGIDTAAASPEAVQRWLARFQPLAGAGRYADADPEAVRDGYTSLVTFLFSDGSAQTIYFQRRSDGLAAVSQPDGPVWRLPSGNLRDLVPRASALRAN